MICMTPWYCSYVSSYICVKVYKQRQNCEHQDFVRTLSLNHYFFFWQHLSWTRRLSKIFNIKKELTDPKLKSIEGVYVYFLQFDLHFDGKVNKVTEMSQFVSLIDGRINARGLGSVQDFNFRWAIQPKLQLLAFTTLGAIHKRRRNILGGRGFSNSDVARN